MSDNEKLHDQYIVTSRPRGALSMDKVSTYIVDVSEDQRVHVADRESLQRAIAAAMRDRRLAE